MKTVNGRKCRTLVQAREEFKSHGAIYARKVGKGYAVFSYGEHWPLHVWDGCEWNSNADKYSVTTSKHYGQTHPHMPSREISCTAMRALLRALHECNLVKTPDGAPYTLAAIRGAIVGME